MLYMITLSALILVGFALLGIIIGIRESLTYPYLVKSPLRQATLDGLALGSIVLALGWLYVVGYGVAG